MVKIKQIAFAVDPVPDDLKTTEQEGLFLYGVGEDGVVYRYVYDEDAWLPLGSHTTDEWQGPPP